MKQMPIVSNHDPGGIKKNILDATWLLPKHVLGVLLIMVSFALLPIVNPVELL